MPAPSTSASRAPGARRASGRSRAGRGTPLPRVRWDRLGRIAMLCVLVALAYLYVSAGVRVFSSWRESKSDSAQVSVLERANRALREEHTTLASPGTVQEEARRFGMIHPGEQVYSVSGLPPN